MYILRLAHTSRQGGHHQVRVALDGDNVSCAAISQFRFEIPAQDRENLRWYLEDYLKFPMEPAPMVAKRVERRISHLGQELFTRIFGGNDASSLWLQIAERLAETRIEVSSEVAAAAMLPWELLRDPHTKIPLALAAHTFVRVPSQPGSGAQPRLSQTDEARIRVLLVICRPAGSDDVPFRSVARRLVGLTASASGVFQLDVLRPPTFARLVEVLREANSRGRPYHVVHFDGHGIWMDVSAGKSVPSDVENGSPCLAPSPARQGPRGFLLFENPDAWDNEQLVDGPALGRLLVETGVPVLVLNACRSAYADPPPAPEKVRAVGVHEGASAYGSLAQDVVDEGVAGVVAMRYNVYVVTATQFVGDLYAALLAGSSLGAAVTRGRKQLDAQPDREIGFHPRPLQDWMVPVVYEAAPLNLFHPWEADQLPSARLKPAGAREPDPGQLDPRLPSAPDTGFCGRDETILAMDLKFNHHQLVLARAYAGAGKTTTAAEFARWYALTGGVTGPVLFTSFGEHLVLSQVLDQLAERFPDQFETQGTSHSDTEPRDQRRQIALEILRQEPVLWIWDSVEPITGFPADSASDWTQAEQNELAEFLREVCETKAKVLLTSRRDESAWLGESVARVELLRMPMTERVELARAVAAKSGHRLTEVDDWRPLLAETQGNPLTLTVLVSQVLRDGLQSRQQIQAFVDRFRAGEIDLADDQRHDRANSLHASLTYGFEHAFTSQEHDVLALLHLFRGTVDVRALCMMGNPEAVGDAAVQLAHGLSREDCIELLDRAAEVGVLHAADSAIGRLYADRSDISRRLGYYFIHPALPWYLRTLFTRAIGPRDSQAELATRRAYATAIADLGDHWNRRYNEGDVVLAYLLAEEEANLLHAWELARANGWGNQIIGTMQALHMLYQHTGRWETWARLVELATPNLVDLDTDHPLPGREGQWRLITTYRVVLAEQAHDWPTAERLQRLLVDWDRNQAATALTADPAALEPHRRNRIHTLAAALDTLGEQLREQRDPDCVLVLPGGTSAF